MGNRVILATIIVAVAIMMVGSAVMPAMAQPQTDSNARSCQKVVDAMAKLVIRGVMDADKAAEKVAKACSG